MVVRKKDKVVPVLDSSWESQSCSSLLWKLGRTWWFQSFIVSDNILSASSVWHWTGVSCPECPYLWEELHQSATLSPPSFLATWELFAWCSRLMVCWGFCGAAVRCLSASLWSPLTWHSNQTFTAHIWYRTFVIPCVKQKTTTTNKQNPKRKHK